MSKIKGLIKIVILVMLISISLVSCNTKKIGSIDDLEKEIQENILEKTDFSDDALNHYSIEAKFDTENSIIQGTQILTYTNNENLDLDKIYFHIYPNAFTKEDFEIYDAEYKKGPEDNLQYGYLKILSAEIDGVSVKFSNDSLDTVLKVEHDKFEMNKTYEVKLTYEISMVAKFGRFGGVNGRYNICNWYPILAVYDEEGWNLDPYYEIGDPFYSESSNYDVSFEINKDFIVAGSGYIYDMYGKDDKKTYKFRGDNIRDFAIITSNNFSVLTETVNGTLIQMYYPKDIISTDVIIDSFVHTMNSVYLFSDVIGPYPYKTYSVVISDFVGSGMEYPSLVLISSKYCTTSASTMKDLIVHETAHQWFYGIIGNNEVDEAWIDEGLASFLQAYYDLKNKKLEYEQFMSKSKWMLEYWGGVDSVEFLKPLGDFAGGDEYMVAVYKKSMLMFSEIYDTFGEEQFKQFLNALYKYDMINTDDVVHVAESVFDERIDIIFDLWLK